MALITKTRSVVPGFNNFIISRNIHITAIINRNSQSARYKPTLKRNKPLTYEMSLPPEHIAHKKSWNSWNTSNLKDGNRPAETLIEDMFIRKFMIGTFPQLILSEVIIKRQHNIIRIGAVLHQGLLPNKLYFLIGYTEELLSYWLQCPIKLELQTVPKRTDLIYKYI